MHAKSESRNAALPNGEAGAAILACGIGVSLFGVIVVLAEGSSDVSQALTLITAVGPLSGKVTVGIVSWLVSWGILRKLWGDRQINFGIVWWIALALIGAGFVLTFPPVFGLFAH